MSNKKEIVSFIGPLKKATVSTKTTQTETPKKEVEDKSKLEKSKIEDKIKTEKAKAEAEKSKIEDKSKASKDEEIKSEFIPKKITTTKKPPNQMDPQELISRVTELERDIDKLQNEYSFEKNILVNQLNKSFEEQNNLSGEVANYQTKILEYEETKKDNLALIEKINLALKELNALTNENQQLRSKMRSKDPSIDTSVPVVVPTSTPLPTSTKIEEHKGSQTGTNTSVTQTNPTTVIPIPVPTPKPSTNGSDEAVDIKDEILELCSRLMDLMNQVDTWMKENSDLRGQITGLTKDEGKFQKFRKKSNKSELDTTRMIINKEIEIREMEIKELIEKKEVFGATVQTSPYYLQEVYKCKLHLLERLIETIKKVNSLASEGSDLRKSLNLALTKRSQDEFNRAVMNREKEASQAFYQNLEVEVEELRENYAFLKEQHNFAKKKLKYLEEASPTAAINHLIFNRDEIYLYACKSLQDKEAVFKLALATDDTDVIVTTIRFLKYTLKKSIFQKMVLGSPIAVRHLTQYLKKESAPKYKNFLKKTQNHLELAHYKYFQALKEENVTKRMKKLDKLVIFIKANKVMEDYLEEIENNIIDTKLHPAAINKSNGEPQHSGNDSKKFKLPFFG